MLKPIKEKDYHIKCACVKINIFRCPLQHFSEAIFNFWWPLAPRPQLRFNSGYATKNYTHEIVLSSAIYSYNVATKTLKLSYSIGGFECIFINVLKSAPFSLQISENNLQLPKNHFKGQIGG